MDKHLFFEIIERLRLEQQNLAREMGVSESQFSSVKGGYRTLRPSFADAATAAFERLGIWHPSGRPYRRDELFAAVPPTTEVSRVIPTGSEVT